MINTDKILNIFFVIIVLIITSLIYFKYKTFYENFSVKTEEQLILEKCPRGCGYHKSVPDCDECVSNKPNYETSNNNERLWIDKYHIIGDQMENHVKDIIVDFKEQIPDINFRFKFLFDNKLHNVTLHPNYYTILYEKYNPEKNSSNIHDVYNWIKKLRIDLSELENTLENVEHTNNWKYIDYVPSQWVIDTIHNIVIEHQLYSNEYKNLFLKDNNVSKESKEYLYNIFKIDNNSFTFAKERWDMFKDSETNQIIDSKEYSEKIIGNLCEGKGLHINDIILLFSLDKNKGKHYINKILELLEKAEKNRLDYLENTLSIKENDFIIKLNNNCTYNENDKLFTEINIPYNVKKNNIEIYQQFWPIFDNMDYNLNKNKYNNYNYCYENVKCYDDYNDKCLYSINDDD
jgi:hypothetical protein